MTTGAIIQARMGASRLPGKVALDLCGKTVLERVIDRVSRCKRVDKVIVATTTGEADAEIVRIAQKAGVPCFRGSEQDVLSRYYYAAKEYQLDSVVRITADCPLIDAGVIDQVVEEFVKHEFDYVSNTMPPTYPDGLDCEVMTFAALEKSFLEAALQYEREHVTQYVRNHDFFRHGNVQNAADLSAKRWTLDEPEDLELIKAVYRGMHKEYFGMEEVLEFLKDNPEIELINSRFQRNEGLAKSIREEVQSD